MAKKRVLVIGAGFGGLAASALLAKKGFDVTVVEKNEQAGGRARVWKKDGFVYDMGPSWYLMPDVFEKYFAEFGKKPEDLMDLKRLDPSYRIFFGEKEKADITASLDETKKLFESYEKGASARFDEYLEKSSYQYDIAMNEFVYRDYNH
ncbi:MAG: FAD-dependent oxidoreductase, partial [Candidatus Thermoplasmatota archaeon]|nr:FAD-dependent oxidoreductase [Candidatus Thermoplasmatota archaeon]